MKAGETAMREPNLGSNAFGQGENLKHQPQIFIEGHDQPTYEYLTLCSCGWSGIVIEQHLPSELIDTLLPAARELVDKHGIKALLRPHATYGEYEDAVKLVLDHIKYDPSLDMTLRVEAYTDVKKRLQHRLEKFPSTEEEHKTIALSSKELSIRTEELLEARIRGKVFEREPVEEQHDPYLYSLLQQEMNDYFNSKGKPPF